MEKELTIDILSSVQKPARYTGGEFGSIIKPAEETEVTIALAFPATETLIPKFKKTLRFSHFQIFRFKKTLSFSVFQILRFKKTLRFSDFQIFRF